MFSLTIFYHKIYKKVVVAMNKNNNHFENFINQDFGSFSDWLSSLNAYEFTAIAVLIGFAISPTLTINQQNSLGNFLELVGQLILTVNAQATTVKQAAVKNPNIKPYFETDSIEKEILLIKKEIIQLRSDALTDDKA